jgi:hypothetical protein
VNPKRESKSLANGFTMNDRLHEALRRISITEIWRVRGWRGKPGKSCHFPGEERDRRNKAACSLFVSTTGKNCGLEIFKDHRQGKVFDAVSLLAAVEGMSNSDACKVIIELAGLSGVKPLDAPVKFGRRSAPAVNRPPPSRTEPPKAPIFDVSLLDPRNLTVDEIKKIAGNRYVSVETVESLVRWGVLHAVTLTAKLRLPIPRQSLPIVAWSLHSPSWDSFRLRPLEGQFPGFDGRTHKSLTPSGASCSQPIWIGPENAQRVLIVEGEGDACGAVEIARRERKPEGLAVVVLFSSSIGIPSFFLPRLEGRRVRIIPHICDTNRQGEIASVRWAASVRPWAADIQIFTLSGLCMPTGRDVTDLGELAQCPDGTLHSLGGITTW